MGFAKNNISLHSLPKRFHPHAWVLSIGTISMVWFVAFGAFPRCFRDLKMVGEEEVEDVVVYVQDVSGRRSHRDCFEAGLTPPQVAR